MANLVETTSARVRDRIIAEGGRLVRVIVDGAGENIPIWVLRPPRRGRRRGG